VSLETSEDGGPKRFEVPPCSDFLPEIETQTREFKDRSERFYTTRIVDSRFKDPPESFAIRRTLRNMFEGTGRFPDVAWTWNSRHYASMIKTRIIYEAYPNSQDEVDAVASKLGLAFRVLYDP
jgi:hypothetical protein